MERGFQKLLLNFTWWVNRKDSEGNNVFEGGFLGLDNVGIFDRSRALPSGETLEQADATSWMGVYCLNMLAIALELARENKSYEDMATKFFEHFLYIADAINNVGENNVHIWNEEDGFYYDVLHLGDGQSVPIKIRSMVGLIPLFAVETIDPKVLEALPEFKKRFEWFIKNRPDLRKNVACLETQGTEGRRLLSIVSKEKLTRILEKMLDENNFLSPYGIRSLSKIYSDKPYIFSLNGQEMSIDYEPAESTTWLFGGNSNWRGPVWYPVNYLLIEALQKFHYYYGDSFKVDFPTGSGRKMDLWDVATGLSHRLMQTFIRNENGRRAVYENFERLQNDPHWKDYLLFFEYFHGDTGKGLGANHQTGWTALVAKLIQQRAEYSSGKNSGNTKKSKNSENINSETEITVTKKRR